MTGDMPFNQPWDVLADFVAKRGYTLTEARDRVILAWLFGGNTDPYCDWVERGHTPSHRVALLVARMMRKGKLPDDDTVSNLLCGLRISGDERTLPDLEGDARKFLAGRQALKDVEVRTRAGEKSIKQRADDNAAKLAAEISLANNVTIGASTVRQVRMELQRGIKTGVMPEILRRLACWE